VFGRAALVWLLQKRGATRPQHLSDAVAALSVSLGADEIKPLEAPYLPRRVSGFS